MKVLQFLKAAVTRWLSHGAAYKRCRERYEQIIKALDDILVKNRNVEWIGYRYSLLKPTTVFQITFLDVLSVTNGLCFLLNSDKKDFGAISRAVNSTLVILEEIKEDVDSIYLKSFKQSEDIIERILLIEMRSTVAGGTRKQSRIDASITRLEFHSSTISPFIDALMKEITYAFDLSELLVLTASLKLDPYDALELEFRGYKSYINSQKSKV